MGVELEGKFPRIAELKEAARKRTPFFAWEYLDSGTGHDQAVARNEQALAAIEMMPLMGGGRFEPQVSVELFGQTYSQPFGVAPIGLSGLMWPGIEKMLASMAAKKKIPYTLSTVACEALEPVADKAGGMGWFQLYPPKEEYIRKDLLKRAKDAGYKALAVTLDVPIPSRRERQVKVGLSVPPKVTPLMLSRVMRRPAWALATLAYGKPEFRGLKNYFSPEEMQKAAILIGTVLDARPDWALIKTIRKEWDGPMMVKGIMDVDDAALAVDAGVDGVWVSNHGGRQFDGAPAAIDQLPKIADAVGDRTKVIFDSGLRSGLDIARAISLGADFCMLGRPFMYGGIALGQAGAEHVHHILAEDLRNAMIMTASRDLAAVQN